MNKALSRFAGLTLCAMLLDISSAIGAELILITNDEAKLPPPKEAVESSRAVTRGPKIDVVAQPGTKSPINLQLKFRTFGGSTIDVGSFQATYLRTPDVDLTARIRPFVNAGGIDLKDAELPPGNHTIRFGLKDSEGRVTKANVTVKIDP